jgi:hypothetical protein
MYMNPGDIIAITQIAYKSACIAVDTASNAIRFFADSESLVVRLEIERFRLKAWAIDAGLDRGELRPALLVMHHILCRQLDLIKVIFQDADKLRDRYAMLTIDPDSSKTDASVDSATISNEAAQAFLKRMRKSLRGIGGVKQKNLGREGEDDDDDDDTAGIEQRVEPGLWKRMRWGIRDKEQFSERVTELHDHVNILHQLLSETERQKSKQDEERIKILVVGSAVDASSLDLIRSAVAADDVDIRAMAERKALSEDIDAHGAELASRQGRNPSMSITLSDLALPSDYSRKQRLLAALKNDPQRVVLMEKKAYDPDIDHAKKNVLFKRVQRLAMLLGSTQSPALRTPKALDYISDSSSFCWWLVLEFPVDIPASMPLPEPLTLHQLLRPSTKFRPPFEQRVQLATSLCETMSSLYSSGWLHKSLRSANVLFPFVDLPNYAIESRIICEPLISGFEYSRQETDMESINNAMMFSNVAAAIYRHPHYQGESAQGYRIEFDVYSLGLVLVDIALWMPLSSFLDASNAAGQKRFPSNERFHRTESLILKTIVLDRLKKEFAFRLGTVYFEVVRWCLTVADLPLADPDDDPAHPALQFYNNVLAPLQGLKLLG